jgi:hypothetical protein
MKEVYDINKDISSATRIAVLQACLRSGISYMTQPSGAATCIRGRADAGGGRQVIRLAGRRPGKHAKRLANFNYPGILDSTFFFVYKNFSGMLYCNMSFHVPTVVFAAKKVFSKLHRYSSRVASAVCLRFRQRLWEAVCSCCALPHCP